MGTVGLQRKLQRKLEDFFDIFTAREDKNHDKKKLIYNFNL